MQSKLDLAVCFMLELVFICLCHKKLNILPRIRTSDCEPVRALLVCMSSSIHRGICFFSRLAMSNIPIMVVIVYISAARNFAQVGDPGLLSASYRQTTLTSAYGYMGVHICICSKHITLNW